jgi:hypothetical protein
LPASAPEPCPRRIELITSTSPGAKQRGKVVHRGDADDDRAAWPGATAVARLVAPHVWAWSVDVPVCIRSDSGVAMQIVTATARELAVQAVGAVIRLLGRVLVGRGQGDPPASIWRMVSP